MLSLFINWNPSPDIFTIPGIDWPVRWYGLSWAMAFIGCHFFMNRIYKAEGRTEAQLDVLTLYIVIATVLGARLGHCLFYGWEYYSQHPLEILKVWEGGLASHGGGIGILIGMWLYCRKTKESWLWLFDRLIVVVPFASFMIRFGNLMNSEIIGEPTNVWKNKRNDFGKGFMFGLFCILMFGFRFGMEFMKENQEAFEASLPINMGQILSIPFILVGLYMMYRSKQESKHINPSEHS